MELIGALSLNIQAPAYRRQCTYYFHHAYSFMDGYFENDGVPTVLKLLEKFHIIRSDFGNPVVCWYMYLTSCTD